MQHRNLHHNGLIMNINLLVESSLNNKIQSVSDNGRELDELAKHHISQTQQPNNQQNNQQSQSQPAPVGKISPRLKRTIKWLERHRDHILNVGKDLI